MEKKWRLKAAPEAQQVAFLSEAINVNAILAGLLVQRNILTYAQARSFFRPDLNELHSPLLMKDMEQAVFRLQKAISANEKILVYGDYDVDGITAIASFYGFLKNHYPNIDFYVPDRFTEGYGISQTGVDWAAENHFTLVIALDCGIRSAELIAYAQNKGIDFIICDHHLPGKDIPKAAAILNPKQEGCAYPFKELSGCGIGFKLLQAFCEKQKIDPKNLFPYLDLVALSIAADIVPIVGENRILTFHGLQKINQNPRLGLKILLEIAGISDYSKLDVSGVVFILAPRINAVGRLQHAKEAVQLLLSSSEDEARKFAASVDEINKRRKELDSLTTQEALCLIEEENTRDGNKKSTVLFHPNWNKGILGIVASRCIEYYHRPTIILTSQEGLLVGSARSIPGFDLHSALQDCAQHLLKFGGHEQAAGLSLLPENLVEFRKEFELVVSRRVTAQQLTPVIEVDMKISLGQLNFKFLKILNQMAPFGPKNMRPVFVSENVKVHSLRILKDAHLKIAVKEANSEQIFDVIGFGMAELAKAIKEVKNVDICYTIEENIYQNNTYLQLRLKDIKVHRG